MKDGDLVALEKACDEVIEASIKRYAVEKKFGPYHYRLDLREVLSRERLGQAPIDFSLGYMGFLQIDPKYNETTQTIGVTVDLQHCVLNVTQCRQLMRASC